MLKSNIAPCGLDCEMCRVYIATRVNDTETLVKVGQVLQSPHEEVMCDGCRAPSDRVWLGCRDCGLRRCEQSKQLPTCARCTDFPCDRTKEFEATWSTDLLTKAYEALKKS